MDGTNWYLTDCYLEDSEVTFEMKKMCSLNMCMCKLLSHDSHICHHLIFVHTFNTPFYLSLFHFPRYIVP